MKISELIERLEHYKKEVGDVVVWVEHYDSSDLHYMDVNIGVQFALSGSRVIVISGEV